MNRGGENDKTENEMSTTKHSKEGKCTDMLEPYDNAEFVGSETDKYLVVIDGKRCAFCAQIYDANNAPVDMSRIKYHCGLPGASETCKAA